MIVHRKGLIFDIDIKKNLLFCEYEDFKQGKWDYSLFAERLCYECKEDQEKSKFPFHLVRTSKLYYSLIYEIDDNPTEVNLPSSNIEKAFSGVIVAYDGEKLLITVRCDEYFYEIECDYISYGGFGSKSMLAWHPKYFSHKYTEEEMKKNYKDSNGFYIWLQHPFKSYICKVERMPSDNDISLKFLKSRTSPPNHWPDSRTNYYSGIPDWGKNVKNEELSCSIKVDSDKKVVYYKIEKDDFKMTNYTTDRDGGWFVYLKKDYVEGLKRFKKVYDIQDYLVRISKKANVKYKYPGEVNLTCHYPFKYSTFIQFTCSIDDFFSEIEVDDYWTVVEEERDNVSLTGLSDYVKD